ncbi:hypothetical protein EWM17_19845, partial [Clostridioides difficile]
GGSIDDKRFLKNNFDKDDEFVRVYSTDNFLGLGKLSKHNNTILCIFSFFACSTVFPIRT